MLCTVPIWDICTPPVNNHAGDGTGRLLGLWQLGKERITTWVLICRRSVTESLLQNHKTEKASEINRDLELLFLRSTSAGRR